jgi:hypothetical protein
MRNIPGTLSALLAVSVVAMNLLANKSIDTHLDWLALDCGILFSWVVFMVMDIVTRRYGMRAANLLSVGALLLNLFVALILLAVSFIPGTWSQSYVDGSETVINGALNATIASTWYVLLGSSIAFITSAVLNNFLHYVIHRALKRQDFLAFSICSYASTFVAQFVDNLLFALIVSLRFFGWSITQCLTCAVTGALAELLCEVIFSPIGYRVVTHMERDNVGQPYLDWVKENRV